MTPTAELDSAKLDALVLYIVSRVENPSDLGATKLHKILWFSDLALFASRQRSIAGETYIKMPRGPWAVHAEEALTRLKRSGAVAEKAMPHYNKTQRRFFATRDADISGFTAEEISTVDSMISAICHNHTASSISDLSHSRIWETTSDRAVIPLETVFALELAEPTQEDLDWARTAFTTDAARELDLLMRPVS